MKLNVISFIRDGATMIWVWVLWIWVFHYSAKEGQREDLKDLHVNWASTSKRGCLTASAMPQRPSKTDGSGIDHNNEEVRDSRDVLRG